MFPARSSELDELLEKVKPKIEFFQRMGRAVGQREPKSLAERWQGPDCILEAKLSKDGIEISGTYERETNALAFGLLGSAAGPKVVTRYTLLYAGTFKGRIIDAVLTRTREGHTTPRSLLDAIGDTRNVLMVLSDDDSEIWVVENPSATDPTYYSIARLAN